jgi:hypothetical protein
LTGDKDGITTATVKSVRFAGDHQVVELIGDWPGSIRAHVVKSELAVGTTVGIVIGSQQSAGAVASK